MKTITIKPRMLGRYDDVSPFIIADRALEISVRLPETSGEFFFVSELNGKTEKHEIRRDGTITIENLTAGELHSEVKRYLRGMLIETFRIEPLILTEADSSISATPEILNLRKEITYLKKSLESLSDTCKGIEKIVKDEAIRADEFAKKAKGYAESVSGLTKALASVKTANETLANGYNEAIKVVNDLSARVTALEKNYDPTIIK